MQLNFTLTSKLHKSIDVDHGVDNPPKLRSRYQTELISEQLLFYPKIEFQTLDNIYCEYRLLEM